jgi:probable HAF family extracellular repeat protein
LVLAGVSAAQARRAAYPYTLIDPGTFGGPQSFPQLPGFPLTANGAVLGIADTSTPDTDFPNFNPFMISPPGDPFVAHAFVWRDGHLRDLGALPGNNSSSVFEVNGAGVGVGASETATYDPNTGWPADHAVMYENGQVKDLGTLPGGFESQANNVNDRGQVSGFASNGIPDPFNFFAVFGGSQFSWVTQARSFIWQNGVMTDIGTLGGPDAVSTTLNARGQITGQSWSSATANPATGIPTLDPFLWQNGHMRDLGTLGGTIGMANWLNNAGDVVGASDLTGDQTVHPFLWKGKRMRDLGTLGGTFGQANYINDAGVVVGYAGPPGDTTAHAFLWEQGAMTDLTGGDSSQCTFAVAINNRGQVVGARCDEPDALLWSDGKQYDLNTLIAPSDVQLTEAQYISDRGQIFAEGVLPDGSQRVFLLVRTPSAPLPASSTQTHPLTTTSLRNVGPIALTLAPHATHQSGVVAPVLRQLLLRNIR